MKCKLRVLTLSVRIIIFGIILTFFDYKGFGYYYLLLVIPFLFYKIPKFFFDSRFIVITVWGWLYAIKIIYFTQEISYGQSLQFAIDIPIFYLAGRYLGSALRPNRLAYLVIVISISFGCIAIISIVRDVAENGFVVIGMARNIPLIGLKNSEGYIAATLINSRLLPAISLIILIFFKQEVKCKKIIIAISIAALICAVRIQSRTSIVFTFGILSLIIFKRLRRSSFTKCLTFLLLLLFITTISIPILSEYSDDIIVLNRFQNESNLDGGGRFERVEIVSSMLMSYPFGGMFLQKSIPYAHNLWLDCARVSGIVSMQFIICICLWYVKNLLMLKTIIGAKSFPFIVLNSISLSIFTIFLTEPVLEGIPLIYGFFIFLWGLIANPSSNSNIKKKNATHLS